MGIEQIKRMIFSVIQILVGSALSAFAVACFALPYDMVVSGVSGIGRVFHYYLGLNLSMVVLVVNVSLFMLGFIMLGKKFAAATLVGTFSFPAFLAVFQNIAALQHLVNDPLMAAICAGLCDGLGLGLIFRTGGSSGGVDVPPLILNNKLGWKVAPMIYLIDFTIFMVQLPLSDTNAIILGILYALVYTVVLNRISILDQGGVQFMIFSDKADEINEKLLSLDFGTTIFHGESGYLHEPKKIIYCVASNRYASQVKRNVLDIDGDAFISAAAVNEINGNGFTLISHEVYNPNMGEREFDVMKRLQNVAKKAKK